MHIQPDSPQIRRDIPLDQYVTLQAQAAKRSLIGQCLAQMSLEKLQARHDELAAFEAQGFVYQGEKNWLEAYLTSTASREHEHYAVWVWDNLCEYLGLSFDACNGHIASREALVAALDHTDTSATYHSQLAEQPSLNACLNTVWRAQLLPDCHLMGFSALPNPGYCFIEEGIALDLHVAGSLNAPSPAHLCALFAALHDLEYLLALSATANPSQVEVIADGIDVVSDNPQQIAINLYSEYGSVMDISVDMTRIGRKRPTAAPLMS
uniref:hypothetical protein n=1 Tax=Thaumasiovibrio occultus TaxID=1891184 RepID=UPI000B35BAED|nr:hypothetical protein [Thaumasiovibrio occultus]